MTLESSNTAMGKEAKEPLSPCRLSRRLKSFLAPFKVVSPIVGQSERRPSESHDLLSCLHRCLLGLISMRIGRKRCACRISLPYLR